MEALKPLKDHLVQSRMDDNELSDFVAVKKILGAKSSSAAVRQMVEDEKVVERARRQWKNGNHDGIHELVSQLDESRCLPMTEVLSGLANTHTAAELQIVRAEYQDLQAELESLLFSLTKAGTNLNQIAKALNTAQKQIDEEGADIDNEEFWTWIAKWVNKSSQTLSMVHQKASALKVDLGFAEKESGTHVYSGDTPYSA